MTGAAHHRGESKQDYATPREFIRAVEAKFGKLMFDLAASPENTIVGGDENYFDEARDSLKQDWTKLEGNVWLNPPFAEVTPWAKKCFESYRRPGNPWIFFLVPAAVGSNWFAEYVFPHSRVHFLRPRLSFDGKNPYPKDLMLAVYGAPPGIELWKWK